MVDNNCTIGNYVNIQTSVYLPTGTTIGDYVFLGPGATFTNDRFPIRQGGKLKPVTVERGASLGANSVVLPGLTVGEGAFVAANAVVTKDVPPWHQAMGIPAEFRPLPEEMRVLNDIT